MGECISGMEGRHVGVLSSVLPQRLHDKGQECKSEDLVLRSLDQELWTAEPESVSICCNPPVFVLCHSSCRKLMQPHSHIWSHIFALVIPASVVAGLLWITSLYCHHQHYSFSHSQVSCGYAHHFGSHVVSMAPSEKERCTQFLLRGTLVSV